MFEQTNVGRFLGMVGALIWSPSKEKYLILKRSGEKDFAGLTWECGTGRVDQGENFTQALGREVREELGIDIQIDFIIGTAHFYRGAKLPENEMLGVFYCCTINDPDLVKMSWEHSEFRWVTPSEAEETLSKGYWLSQLISRADRIRLMTPPEIIELNHKIGFDL
jgi:8-oxo-dGTP pyrophosphatase MutT (NUDIX family)